MINKRFQTRKVKLNEHIIKPTEKNSKFEKRNYQ